MKAYTIKAAGESPAHQELDIPEPGPGEVRIRVTAASVNGSDVAVAAGYMGGLFEYRYPVVLGREVTGVVDTLGEGVTDLGVGDRVFGVVSKPYLAEGAFAEYTTAEAANFVRTPASLGDQEAAGLGHAGSTALSILSGLGAPDGRTILIVGATGGVGTLLTQLAAAKGFRVIATARTDVGRALLVQLGAAEAVDYADLGVAVRAVAPEGVDGAVHLAGDPVAIAPLVKDGGMFVSAVLYAPETFPDSQRLTPVPVAGFPTSEGLHLLADSVELGSLRVIIDHEHDFGDIAGAFSGFGRHTLGNIVVRIGKGTGDVSI